jgi:predicted transcriptional regulator
MNIPTLKTPYSKINNLLYMSYLPKVINVAININLFEILSGNSLSLSEIVTKLNTQKEVTEALLGVLTLIGLVVKENNKYSLTELSGEYLVQTSGANQLHEIKRFTGSAGPFDYLQQALKGENPEFDGKMWSSKEAVLAMEQGAKSGAIQNVVSFVKTIPGFGSCTNMCDFAGSIGYYSYAFLQENPNLRSHVYDLPAVCQIAKEIKQEEKNFDRITYHDFDITTGDSFGEGYDLFFSSHFLYEFGDNDSLTQFLTRVNQSMKPGGIFISNHICNKTLSKEDALTLSLVELQTRTLGYPTHQLPEETLKNALTKAGFGDFRVKQPDGSYAFPTLLLAAKKISEQ